MSRLRAALLVTLGLTSRGVAQTPGPVAWTYEVPDFIIHGHTTYSSTLALVPRLVYDTLHGVDSVRVMDSVRAAAPPAGATGFVAGLSAWPEELYCAGLTSGAMQGLDPRHLLTRLRLAARCRLALVIVAPRRRLSATGVAGGAFSLDSAKRLTDAYAALLVPDTLRKYRAAIVGLNLADDYGCTACWGGTAITQAQIADWAAYTRTRMPELPLGVRVTPDWVQAYPALAPLLDYAWAQYHTRKGDPQAYYDRAATIAGTLGLQVVMGVNVEDCDGVGTRPCDAADLVRLGTLAVTHPASCAFLNWQYDAATWERADIQAAWAELVGLAKARAERECRRGSGAGQATLPARVPAPPTARQANR